MEWNARLLVTLLDLILTLSLATLNHSSTPLYKKADMEYWWEGAFLSDNLDPRELQRTLHTAIQEIW